MTGDAKRHLALIFVLAVVAVVGAVTLAGTIIWSRITEPYKGYAAPEQFVTIQPGANAGEIRRGLVQAGLVRDGFTARAALAWTRSANRLKAGEYRFDRPMSAIEVIERLARGEVYTIRITFPEGLTIAEMASVFEERGLGPAGDFARAASDPAAIRDIDSAAADLEGYLFPETYTISRSTPAAQLVSSMVQRFRASFPEELQRRAREQGFTVREVVTLASLVEKETARADERPLVSAVYRNRLRIGMGMQADPTVVYALRKAGRYDGNIRRADLAFDSPYNTYRYRGLPPGPIAAPGKAALEAALAPADVPYLYFVSRNDGSHVFAETLAQHNANVYEHQVLYFRRQRQR